VNPVVVIMASELIVKGLPDDAVVIGRRKITDWLIARPPSLSRNGAGQYSKPRDSDAPGSNRPKDSTSSGSCAGSLGPDLT
jgi:hypothetical protein